MGLKVTPALLLLSSLAAAQGSPEMVLHEYVQPDNEWVRKAVPSVLAGASGLPLGIRVGEELVTAMEPGVSPQAGEPVFMGEGEPPAGARPDVMRRRSVMVPDPPTSAPERYHYYATFNPSVVPYKRFAAYDAVRADGSLTVADPTQRAVALVGNAARAGREIFYGQLSLFAEAGELVPLPSVAPDMGILSARVEPAMEVEFLVDGADNYWVRPSRGGAIRLILAVDGPSSYFGGPVPAVGLGEMPGLARALPEGVRREAGEVAARLGLANTMPLPKLLGALVKHFRSFAAGDLAGGRGSLYRRIALGRVGACRHRAYAFLVTALGLGVPCRYVSNEAHAFVEVYLPRSGWRRVDLGGTASDLDVIGGQERVLHQPESGPSPWEGEGAPAAATRVHGMPRRAARSGGGGGPGVQGAGQGASQLGRAEGVPAVGPAAEESLSPRRPSRVTVRPGAGRVFRGASLRVAGRVEMYGPEGWSPAEGAPVEAHLVSSGGDEVAIGAGVAGGEGIYDLTCVVSHQTPPGPYRVQVTTAGTAEMEPSASEAWPLAGE